jgi:PAS domain S-box-containing protein
LPILGAALPVLLATGWAVLLLEAEARRTQEARFAAWCDGMAEQVHDRLQACRDVLWGVRGLFLASQEVTASEFSAYVAALRLPERYPAIRGIAYVVRVPPSEVPQVLAAIRAEVTEVAQARPAMPASRDEVALVRYITPAAGNLAALGYDLSADPTRRQALDQARDTGEAVLTARVRLVQDPSGDPGFLLILPVYRGGAIPETLAERRSRLIGWVDAPFTGRDLMQQLPVSPEHTGITITDVTDTAAAQVLGGIGLTGSKPGISAVREVPFAGRRWRLELRANRPDLVGAASWVALVVGLVVSGLLAALFTRLHARRELAESLAANQAAALHRSEDRWRIASDTINEGMWELDLASDVLRVSRRWQEHLGYQDAGLPATRAAWLDLLHPDDRAAWQESLADHLAGRTPVLQLEVRQRHRDGAWRWVHVRAQVRHDDHGLPLQVLGSCSDITERRLIADRLSASEAGYRAVVDHLSLVVFRADDTGRLTFLNRAWEDITGMSAAEALGQTLTTFFHPTTANASCTCSSAHAASLMDGRNCACSTARAPTAGPMSRSVACRLAVDSPAPSPMSPGASLPTCPSAPRRRNCARSSSCRRSASRCAAWTDRCSRSTARTARSPATARRNACA